LSGNGVLGVANTSTGTASGNGVLGLFNTTTGTASGNGVFGAANTSNGFASGNGISGSGNNAVGSESGNGQGTLLSPVSGNNVLGNSSGNTTTGSGNTVIGNSSGNGVSGSNNFVIGNGSGGSSNANSNTFVIGNGATSTASDQIVLGAATGPNANKTIIANGKTTFQNGTAGVPGTTTIDNGNITAGNQVQVGLTASGVTLKSDGTGTFNGLLTANAGLTVHGGTTTDTLIVNNGQTVHGGSDIYGGQTVHGGSDIYGGQTVHGNQKVTGDQTVVGQSYLNGGATISNNLTVSGPGNGGSPTNIDMGGNAIHDVGTPIFATDAANKAYVDKGLNKAYEGTAIALAISQPVLATGQSFALRAGWGDYESQNAFGLSAVGIIGRDWFWGGSTVALDGGVGWGSNNAVAAKAGVTIGFGPGLAAYAPMK
jgi:hypothetical protein